MAEGGGGYSAFVEPGNVVTLAGESAPQDGATPPRLPQMPAYHLKKPGHAGITMINIGVGPSNAKTITDHIAVLRPHAWLMLGHCAGLRNTQALGDYVLAHAYVREDHVLDDDLPVWVPIPALAEVQVALEEAVAEVTGLSGYELKRIMRTGTVATIDNRNWELRDQRGPVQRLSQSRAIALDMESATIAANGFRFRVPYGTLLCVSDKPLHGELKLPGMATRVLQAAGRPASDDRHPRRRKACRNADGAAAFAQAAQLFGNGVSIRPINRRDSPVRERDARRCRPRPSRRGRTRGFSGVAPEKPPKAAS